MGKDSSDEERAPKRAKVEEPDKPDATPEEDPTPSGLVTPPSQLIPSRPPTPNTPLPTNNPVLAQRRIEEYFETVRTPTQLSFPTLVAAKKSPKQHQTHCNFVKFVSDPQTTAQSESISKFVRRHHEEAQALPHHDQQHC